MIKYLEDAKSLLDAAIKELERGKKEGDPFTLGNVAEKALGSVVCATNTLIEKRGFPSPKTQRKEEFINNFGITNLTVLLKGWG